MADKLAVFYAKLTGKQTSYQKEDMQSPEAKWLSRRSAGFLKSLLACHF
jgi:hypothetical protein